MGSTLGYKKGIGEHGRRRRDYYTLFAFDFFVLSVLCFAALHWFLFLSLIPNPFPSCDHLSHTCLARLIVDQIVRCRFFFSSSFHLPSFPFRFCWVLDCSFFQWWGFF